MLSGLVPCGDGTYKRVELRGPPDIATWAAAFLVLRAALLMIGACSMAALDKYYDRVIRLAREYGPEVWMLLYQCDVRIRLEEMPSMRRDILEEVEDIKKAGGVHPYNPSRPWYLVWQRATDEKSDKLWETEFEKPATQVKLALKKTQDVVDGDAPVQDHATAASSRQAPLILNTNPNHTAQPLTNKRPAPSDMPDPEHWPFPNTMNKRNKCLCPGFNFGNCGESKQGGVICPFDAELRHQCAKCLGCDHPAIRCPGGAGRGRGADRGRGGGRDYGNYGNYYQYNNKDRGRGGGRGRSRGRGRWQW